jgi:16S rRNA U1498 N3-methylase RsmE
MQSRRAWLPVLAEVVAFEEVAQAAARVSPVALAQRGGQPPALTYPALLVGPEGGWVPEELASGLPIVGLGPNSAQGGDRRDRRWGAAVRP